MPRRDFLRHTNRLDNPPKLLDLFCGAGGAALGYREAGFAVTGVDRAELDGYPFRAYRADALEFPLDGFDVVHASPPCAPYSYLSAGRTPQAPLIAAVRERIQHLPYVIENVEGARMFMHDPVMLCGSSFGLDVQRHRLFETNWPLPPLPCRHGWQTKGRFDASYRADEKQRSRVVPVYGSARPGEAEVRRKAMEMHWSSHRALVQAIPPAYTRYVGRALMTHLRKECT
jgi:DNA (cytosine-5)-methyltransferase 1